VGSHEICSVPAREAGGKTGWVIFSFRMDMTEGESKMNRNFSRVKERWANLPGSTWGELLNGQGC